MRGRPVGITPNSEVGSPRRRTLLAFPGSVPYVGAVWPECLRPSAISYSASSDVAELTKFRVAAVLAIVHVVPTPCALCAACCLQSAKKLVMNTSQIGGLYISFERWALALAERTAVPTVEIIC